MSEEVSQHEVNKMVRILNGKKLKYTVRVHSGGAATEFQMDRVPQIEFSLELRGMALRGKVADKDQGYDKEFTVMKWPDDGVLLVEVNPE